MPGSLEISLEDTTPLDKASIQLHCTPGVLNYVHGQLGMPVPNRPGQALVESPRDLTALSDAELGNYLNFYGQWVSYIDYQLACANVERQSAESYLTYIQARVRIEIKSNPVVGKKTNQDKTDIMETNPKVLDAREKYMFWESTYQLTRSLRDSVQLLWDTISRRITQRGQEVDRMRRETNVAGVPAAARTSFMRR